MLILSQSNKQIYSFTSNFFNPNYYYTREDKKKIDEKYKRLSSNINFNLKNIDDDLIINNNNNKIFILYLKFNTHIKHII